MVFLKNNTGGGSESTLSPQKSSNLKDLQLLNNKVLNTSFKKDINTLAKNQETSSTLAAAMSESAKESQQPKQNKTNLIGDTLVKKRDNKASAITDSKSAFTNPFTVKLEINIVVVALFAVALGLRLYAIDQPNSVV